MYSFIDLDKQYIGKSTRINQDFVNLMEQRLIKADEKNKPARDKKVISILRKTGSEIWQKHVEKVQSDQKARDDALQKARLDALPKNNP